MASFAALLGHAAGGFEQARQEDLQRQFQDESQRRALAGELMGHIINDPNQPADTRNAMLQSYLGMAQQGPNQKFDFKKAFQPWFDQAAKVRGQQQAAAQSPAGASLASAAGGPPIPPQMIGSSGAPQAQAAPTAVTGAPPNGMAVPPPPSATGAVPQAATSAAPPQQVADVAPTGPPPPPPELLAGAGTVAQNAAHEAGMVAGAQAGAEAKFPVWQKNADGTYKQTFVSGTGQPMGSVDNAVSPYAMMGRGLRQVVILDPKTGQPVPAEHDMIGGRVLYNGQVMPPDTPVFESALLATKHEGFEQVTDAAGNISLVPVTTTTQKSMGGNQTAGAAATKGGPPAPPANVTGGGKNSATPPKPPANMTTPAATPQASAGTAGRVVGHKPVTPDEQDKIQEQFKMRNSAIGLIDDITQNKKVLDDLISSGKIAVAANPDGTGVVSRLVPLTNQEAQVAGDFEQLIEHANLLRGPLGATGFRGQQAWSALQAQRGKPMADPRITAQVMQGMRSRLVQLNDADRKVLQGKGGDTADAEPMVGGYKVGEVIKHADGDYKITKIYPDGTYDAAPVKAAGKK